MAEDIFQDVRTGTTSPAADAALLLQSYDAGALRLNTTPGSSIIAWRCSVAGHPGTWEALYGGLGGPITLRAAYLAGAVALDQTLPLSDADGGGIIIDGSSGTFTGVLSLRVNSAAAGPFVVDRANGYVGIGQAVPLSPMHISVSDGTANAIRLDQSAHQRIEKRGGTGLSIVVPNTTNTAVNWLDFVMGSTSVLKIEPGTTGGPNAVVSIHNSGVWTGTHTFWSTGETFFTGTAFNGSQVTTFTVTAGALTAQNASVELNDIIFNLGRTVQQVGGVNHASNRALKIQAPTYTSTTTHTVDDMATVYIDGAPGASGGATGTRKEALWIGSGNGGGIRTDGFGATGLIKNNNGGLWTLGVAGTDYVAPWSLTSGSVVISGGGSVLTEDAADFKYNITRSRLSVLGQTVMGSTVGFWLAGGPSAPTLTFTSEDFDATETTGPVRDSGWFGVADNMLSVTIGGLAVSTFSSQGIVSYGFLGWYLMGGTEAGRTDASELVIRGGAGSSTTAMGLTFDTSATFTATSGTQRAAYFSYTGYAGGFAPTSGTAAMRYLDLAYEVDQTGGANGTVHGLKVTATRTAVVGTHRFAEFGTTARSTMRIDDTNTSAYVYVGEQSTGFGDAALLLQTNTRQAYVLLDNASNFLIINSGNLQTTALSGSGTQLVQAGATGVLSRFTGVVPTSTVALTGPAVVWTDGSGLLNVDTARFVYDAVNFKVLHPNGSATHPGLAPIGDTNTGIYSYTADSLAISAGGGYVVRFEGGGSTSRYVLIGEASASITGWAYLGFATNARAGAIYLDNAVGNSLISTVGWLYPNGSAAGPAVAWTNSTDTGRYRYAAGVEAVAAAGRYVSRWESTATERFFYVGEQSTGISVSYAVWQTNVRQGIIYLDNGTGNVLISTVGMRVPNGSAAGPSWSFTNATDLGMYYDGSNILAFATGGSKRVQMSSAGLYVLDAGSYGAPSVQVTSSVGLYQAAANVLGLAGQVLVGDSGGADTSAALTVRLAVANDRIRFDIGGGGYTIADNTTWHHFHVAAGGNVAVGKATSPVGSLVFGTYFAQQTYVATGASGTAKVLTGSATVYIQGPPVLSGLWSSAGLECALYVASGRVQIHDNLVVDGVFAANRNGGTPQMSFFGSGGGVAAQASGGTLGGVIAGLVALGLFAS